MRKMSILMRFLYLRNGVAGVQIGAMQWQLFDFFLRREQV